MYASLTSLAFFRISSSQRSLDLLPSILIGETCKVFVTITDLFNPVVQAGESNTSSETISRCSEFAYLTVEIDELLVTANLVNAAGSYSFFARHTKMLTRKKMDIWSTLSKTLVLF
jgi:hypothetical protein